MRSSYRTLRRLRFTSDTMDDSRFEDLVKHLLYSAYDWEELSHPGRLGNDGGIDIRGTQIGQAGKLETWYVQCKQFASAGASQLCAALDECLQRGPKPNIVLVVVACDVTRHAEEQLRSHARKRGVAKVKLWTSSTLQDMLYGGRHDLLYAYFGEPVPRATHEVFDLDNLSDAARYGLAALYDAKEPPEIPMKAARSAKLSDVFEADSVFSFAVAQELDSFGLADIVDNKLLITPYGTSVARTSVRHSTVPRIRPFGTGGGVFSCRGPVVSVFPFDIHPWKGGVVSSQLFLVFEAESKAEAACQVLEQALNTSTLESNKVRRHLSGSRMARFIGRHLQDARPIWIVRPALNRSIKALLEWILHENPGMTARQIKDLVLFHLTEAAEINLTDSDKMETPNIRHALRAAVRAKEIAREGTGASTRYFSTRKQTRTRTKRASRR